MTYYDYLCRLLEPMRVYRTERGTLSGGELYAAGKALDKADGAMEYAEQEGLLQTAEGEGLARREKLFSRCPVSVSTALRREAIAALARINADSFTLDAINSTLSGCGIKALAEETEKKGTVKVWFPNTVGVPDEFSQVESIILDIIPCHLLVEFYFRYLTWLECEAQKFTWQSVEDARALKRRCRKKNDGTGDLGQTDGDRAARKIQHAPHRKAGTAAEGPE